MLNITTNKGYIKLFFFFFEIIQTEDIGDGERESGKTKLTTLALTKEPNLNL